MQMEWNSFYSNSCYECGNWGVGYNLELCKNCRAVSFCNKELCMKNNTKKHEDLCKILTEIRGKSSSIFTINDDNNKNQKCWSNMKTNLMLIVQLKLGRKLNKQEEEVLKFPKRCLICFQINPDKLIDCKLCPSTSFCEKHIDYEKNHTERCQKLIESAASDIFFSPMLKRELPSIENTVNHQLKLPENMVEFLKTCGPQILPFPHNVQSSANSELYTRPLTLAYAMDKLNYHEKSDLTVHIIGASIADLEDINLYELIFHYGSTDNIKLIFVGPDLKKLTINNLDNYFCQVCKSNGKKITSVIEPKFYHEYVNSNDYVKPDVIIGFNAGIHECINFGSTQDTWAETIKLIGNKLTCPFVITSYTLEEAKKDDDRVKKCSNCFYQILFDKNPFSSLRHYRDFESDDFFYQNQYVIIYKNNKDEDAAKYVDDMEKLQLNDDSMICE